jgi:hypothetical protein
MKSVLFNLLPYLASNLSDVYNPKYHNVRNSKGRKRTTTAAHQKRDKIKRKNKGK